MHKLRHFLHRYYPFPVLEWRWHGREKDLQSSPQGENRRGKAEAEETALIAGCVIPGNACGQTTSRTTGAPWRRSESRVLITALHPAIPAARVFLYAIAVS